MISLLWVDRPRPYPNPFSACFDGWSDFHSIVRVKIQEFVDQKWFSRAIHAGYTNKSNVTAFVILEDINNSFVELKFSSWIVEDYELDGLSIITVKLYLRDSIFLLILSLLLLYFHLDLWWCPYNPHKCRVTNFPHRVELFLLHILWISVLKWLVFRLILYIVVKLLLEVRGIGLWVNDFFLIDVNFDLLKGF